MIVIELLFALFTKHFIVDFLLQNKYQWSNKGTFMHPGGLLHVFLHGAVTYFILINYIDEYHAYQFALLEAIAHYFIDYTKMNVNKFYEWKPDTSEKFWYLLGLDQYLHALTYLLIGYYSLEYLI